MSEKIRSVLSATLPQYHVSGIRLDADPVIDGRLNPLLAAQVAFGSLNRDVPQKELNLLLLTSRGVAQPRASPAKIVRRDFGDANGFRRQAGWQTVPRYGVRESKPDGFSVSMCNGAVCAAKQSHPHPVGGFG